MVDPNDKPETTDFPGFAEASPACAAAGAVELWMVVLDCNDEILSGYEQVLSADELERAAKFRFDIHRRRFIAARASLRMILADHTGSAPEEIRFRYGQNGKPELECPATLKSLSFNLSHSENLAAIAVAGSAPVGVDIERLRVLKDFDDVAAQFCSARELQKFLSLKSHEKPVAFFNMWTRKEAWLKATGEGIAHRLKEVEIAFLEDERPGFVSTPEFLSASPGSCWSLFAPRIDDGYKCAVAVGAQDARILHRRLPLPGERNAAPLATA